MQIAVCLKAVPGMVRRVRVAEVGDRLEFESSSTIMNESDEYALEEALALRGKGGGQVTAVSVGGAKSEEVLRLALAKGADRVIRVDADYYDGYRTSLLLAEALRKLNPDLVLAGMESADSMGSQVAVAAASRRGIPFVFGATEVAILDDRTVRVTKELGAGSSEVLEVSLPALLCMQTGGQPLSYAPVAKLIQARRRAIDSLGIRELVSGEGSLEPKLKIIEVFSPKPARSIEFLSGSPRETAHRAAEIMKKVVQPR